MVRLVLKSVAIMVLAAVAAQAQPASKVIARKAENTATGKHRKVAKKKEAAKPAPAAVVTPPPPPPAPKTLAEMPPVAPKVTFANGLLTIDAPNSRLMDVLEAVKRATGIDMDAVQAQDRVIVHIGPGDPKDVLAALLSGSKYDYFILGSAENPNAVKQVIVMAQSGGGVTPPSPNAGFMSRPVPPPQEEPQEEEQEVSQPQPRFTSPAPARGQPMPPDQNASPRTQPSPDAGQNPNQTRTPQQLFEELRRMEQQRAEQLKQQQQQQQNPQ